MEYLAHSAKDGIRAQLYQEHVKAVTSRTVKNINEVIGYCSKENEWLQDIVRSAAEFHDLGKLAKKNQKILHDTEKHRSLPLKHWDAGTAHLLQSKNVASALLVYGHHKGLFSRGEEQKKGAQFFFREETTYADSEQHLIEYLNIHHNIIIGLKKINTIAPILSGLGLRIALSCLVDADHGDTAIHYGNESEKILIVPGRWEERLSALDNYVKGLSEQADESPRNLLRKDVYKSCREGDLNAPLVACDSPVGTGKTTAVMAYLLRKAAAKKLRHIFVVLPYTNIIKQSVDIYRQVLTLPGERPEEVVAEHHHQVEFSDPELRFLTTLWQAPIIITTAVQFFETIGNNIPKRLRKLHQLPGSAVFVDEAHACMPSWMWPQHWLWLQELTEKWGCHFVLASGSLIRFWDLKEFVEKKINLPELISLGVRKESYHHEQKRIRITKCENAFNRRELLDFVISKPGPRLLIMNTVQSAAVMASEFRNCSHDVIHLSTALAPVHRERIIEKVKNRLKYKADKNWTLVATNCVEAGMNFSFRTAFRESSSLSSLYQTAGRVNRNGEFENTEIFSFRTLEDGYLNHHPLFQISSLIQDDFFDKKLLDVYSPAEIVTSGMKREVGRGEGRKEAEALKKAEKAQEYPEVGRLSKIIKADTCLVVVTTKIIERLINPKKRKMIKSQELIRHSVQIWAYKVEQLSLFE